jgi:hypothetical protein
MLTGVFFDAKHALCSNQRLPCSPSDLSVTQKLIDLQEFMFGFQFLFKCQDQHLPEYLFASALWSLFLERINELEVSGWNKDLRDL